LQSLSDCAVEIREVDNKTLLVVNFVLSGSKGGQRKETHFSGAHFFVEAYRMLEPIAVKKRWTFTIGLEKVGVLTGKLFVCFEALTNKNLQKLILELDSECEESRPEII
jgi:hypothetical protein